MVLKKCDQLLKSNFAAVGIFLICLIPLLRLVMNVYEGQLGADPAKTIVKDLGFWAIVMIWITLFASTLSRRARLSFLLRRRRMVGLFAFFYALLHFLAYLTFILGWRWSLIEEELTKRPYIIAGLAALLILLPLAITSTRYFQRRLGSLWKRLHQMIYPASILVMVHIIWMIRASFQDALIFGALLALLLAERSKLFRKRIKK